ncbi:883_t:CDS:2 [Funneliformis caledonium]|uniref:883_t:CDS:1 n=1 Tax=Funneliformis caledonium TaxID=1117310 RepID=A0A9N8ZJH9_9GLOM|nr:883_t:CDS:2 [Funneliformis caledonium]
MASTYISPDLNHVGTSHADGYLAIWKVDDNIVEIIDFGKALDKEKERARKAKAAAEHNRKKYADAKDTIDEKLKKEELNKSVSLIGLSNNKLMICDVENPFIQNMETFKEISIRPHPTKESFLRFLPNGDLLLLLFPYIYIYSEASLRNSTNSPCSYISRHYLWGVEEIKIDHKVQMYKRMYFTLEDQNVLLQLNFETMSIENYYNILAITENIVIGSRDCEWKIAVNSEESLIAIHLRSGEGISWIHVFSTKNGLRISSKEGNFNISEMQFITTNDTEILVLFELCVKVTYTMMNPYDLSYEFKRVFEFQIPDEIASYKIVKASSSQCKFMLLTIENQIKMVDFKCIFGEIYDKDPYQVIDSSFKDIKKPCDNLRKGKKLTWQTELKGLKVLKDGYMDHIDFDRDFNLQKHKILSNEDIVLYSDNKIYIFGFNEKTNTIIPRYYHNNFEVFCESENLPLPSITHLNELPFQKFQNKSDLVCEILSSRKNLIEMSDDIIDHAVNQKGIETLEICLNKLYETISADIITNFRFCSLITKYLNKLNIVPYYYSKFLFITCFIPNPYVNKSYLSDRNKLGFATYPTEYNFWMEILRPSDNPFVTLDDKAFYDSWNAEALLNFKWNSFGKFYYFLSWVLFTIFLLSFGIGSTLSPPYMSDDTRNVFLRISIIFGVFHVFHEVRQIIWNWYRYFTDLWNWFDLFAYIVPVFTAIMWLNHEKPSLRLISISNLFLHFKFIIFLRAIDYFGSNFTIIIGVAKRIFSFLLILLLIIIGFAHAFFIILTPKEDYNLIVPSNNDDPNNPWNLVTKYQSVSNGKILSETAFSQQPDSKSNQFTTYKTSLLAMYLFLTGDSSAISSWTYQENPFLTVLLIMFSFLVVVYLMNLFIGLLNLEIEGNRTHFLFVLQKAKVLAEIELFYLFPNQRRWNHWFPDTIFYEIPIEDVQQRLTDISHNPALSKAIYISDKLRELADLKDQSQMTKADCEYLINKMKADYESLLKKTKTDNEGSMNRFMTKDDWNNSKQEFLYEIKNLLIDKSVDEESRKDNQNTLI